MAGRKGGKVERDAVTNDLSDLGEATAKKSSDFRAAEADADEVRRLISDFVLIRRRKKMSQKEIAQQMATTQSAISELEKGLNEPRISTLQRYARIIGCKLRLRLVVEPVVPYRDRSMHYTRNVKPVPIKPSSRPHTSGLDRSESDSPTTYTVGNVVYASFERRDRSPLGGSIAERLEAVAQA